MLRRVLIDAPLYRSRTRSGVNRFVAEVCDALAASDAYTTYVQAPVVDGLSGDVVRRRLAFRGLSYVPTLDRLVTSMALAGWRADLYFDTYYAWQPFGQTPIISVVYDMIYEKFPQEFSRAGRFIQRKRQCIEGSDHLLCDSAATRDDLLRYYGRLDPQRVHVVHFGVDTDFFRPAPPGGVPTGGVPDTGGQPYWLYIGSRQLPYKNFRRLLEGFASSGTASSHRLLALGGEAGPSAEEAALLHDLGLKDVVSFGGRVSDLQLREAYDAAAALVYPSRYEGFGLPLLEAMACGTLVVSSDAGSLPEVGGEVPFYFAPQSAQSLALTLERVAALSADERRARAQRGMQRASQFTWQRCCSQILTLFDEILAGAPERS